MKITQFDDLYTTALGFGGTTLVTGTSGGSNSGLGGDVTGTLGDVSVVSLRELVSLASNMGDNTIGSVLTTISSSPWVAEFAISSNAAVSAGSNATRVSAASTGGVAATYSRSDHRHDGIATVTSSSSNTLGRPNLNIRAGANVGITATDTDGDGALDTITIHSTGTSGGASGVSSIAKSGSAALTGAVTLTGGTNVTLTQSGNDISIAATGGGGGTTPGLDTRTLNGTYGDHFTAASLDVKWSRHNQTSGEESYQQGPSATHMRVAYSTATVPRYIYQTAPNGTNETWECAIDIQQTQSSGEMFGLLMVDNTGAGVGITIYNNARGMYLCNLVAHTYSSTIASRTYPAFQYESGQRMWIKLRKAAGVYSGSMSFNGWIYTPEATNSPTAFTPTRIGVGRFLGADASDVLDIDWFDKTA